MQPSRRDFLKIAGLTGALAAVGGVDVLAGFAAAPTPLAADDPLLHLLNRLSYGTRPEDLERARAIGLEAYLDEQLNPELIDDSAMDERLKALPILGMDRFTAYKLTDKEYRTYIALTKGMIERAVYSQRQLFERMAEFWTDHFNIPSDSNGPDVITFQREIRANALGSFRDLLFGVAKSPAMLYYLDNYLNKAEHPNENYARELMELHTLGVDGGYTETDVKEVARALTGWTVDDGTESGFYFDPDEHDTGEKNILSHNLPAERGIEDGLHVLSILTHHPSTAAFICRKLCVRFVSDNPPQSLVDSMAAVWTANDGQIRPVLRHLFTSEEFKASAGQKLRRPLDFMVGAMRATGTEIHVFYRLESMLQELAQMPYGWQPPNGYPDVAGAWTTSGGLLARWNTALALTHGAYSETEVEKITTSHLYERIGQPQTVGELVDNVANQVFATNLPDDSRNAFITFTADGGDSSTPVDSHLLARKLGSLFGLMLASPQYQWR